MDSFLNNTIKLAGYYRSIGRKTIDRLTEAELNWSPGSSSNSIATLVKHLSGNMLSRWTHFLTEDGEKEWRNRENEFDSSPETKAEVIGRWEEGWDCFISALKELTSTDLNKIIYIRNEGHTVVDAVQRQMAHYPYHIGQMIYIAKMHQPEWESLSIPPGQSDKFNESKFSSDKATKHFTDEI